MDCQSELRVLQRLSGFCRDCVAEWLKPIEIISNFQSYIDCQRLSGLRRVSWRQSSLHRDCQSSAEYLGDSQAYTETPRDCQSSAEYLGDSQAYTERYIMMSIEVFRFVMVVTRYQASAMTGTIKIILLITITRFIGFIMVISRAICLALFR